MIIVMILLLTRQMPTRYVQGNNIAVVNNLKYGEKHFKTQLSFRKKSRWISEPDVLATSRFGVDLIDSFETIQYHEGKHLYSDHALLHLVLDLEKVKISTSMLKRRANYLGASVYESYPIKNQKSRIFHPLLNKILFSKEFNLLLFI